MEMKKIFVTGKYAKQVLSIKNEINFNSKLHWELVEKPEEATLLLFFDFVQQKTFNYPGTKILVRQEPKMVLAENYNAKNLAHFDLVVDVGKPKDGISKNINWPQKINLETSKQLKSDSSKTILINSNLLSLHRDEMYSLRRTVSFNSDTIDLFGYNWNIGKKESLRILLVELRKFICRPWNLKISGLRYFFQNQKNYKGSVKNKIQTMERYRSALIVENSLNYVSEKLFDSFSARCIPVYVGPDLERYGIPSSLYLQAEPDQKSVIKAISSVQEIDYEYWLNELEVWLKSDDCKDNWAEETFLIRLKELID